MALPPITPSPAQLASAQPNAQPSAQPNAKSSAQPTMQPSAPSFMPHAGHRNVRVWLLSIVCLALLAGTAISYWPATVAFASAHPHTTLASIMSFILCLAYATELSSIPLSCRHSVIPLLTIMLLITGTFNGLFLPLIIVTLLSSAWTARSVLLGSISATSALTIVPVTYLVLGDEPGQLRAILVNSVPTDTAFHYLIGHWIVPLVILAFAFIATRFLCDIIVFIATGSPIRAALQEYSVTRTTGLAIADLAAAIITIWIPAIFEFSFDLANILDVHALFLSLLDIYALALMSYYTMRHLARTRNSLHSITAITDALPLPHEKPEDVIVSIINSTLPNVRCFVCEPHHLPYRIFHTYRVSQPIGNTRNPRVIVFERSMLNRPFLTADGEVLASAAAILSEELRAHREVTMLRTESETDPLTGAYTYASLVAYLKTLQTENSANTIAIIYVELERFRHVNEHYGRRTGNMVLRTTAARIRSLMPDDGMLVRVGGDGFVVVLQDKSNDLDLPDLASKLHDATSLPLHVDHDIVSVSTIVSTSVLAPSNFSQLNSILESAGVDLGEESTDVQEDTSRSTMPSESLREAIESGSFTLRYQPVLNLDRDTIIGVIAIPHITDADGHVLSHDFIVNEALRLSLGAKLTTDIIRQGVAFLTQLQSTTEGLNSLGIILNGGELEAPAFYEQIENTSKAHPNITLHLQFGHDAMQQAPSLPDFAEDLLTLAALPNVSIAIADAGTSFSELSALSTIPANSMVFDSSVTQDLDNPRTHSIVAEMLRSAKQHDFNLFFSGVSQPHQVEQLHKLGCSTVLGDVFATAMTESELRMRLTTTGLSANAEYVLPADKPANDSTDSTAQQEKTPQRGKHYEVPEIRPITRPSFDD